MKVVTYHIKAVSKSGKVVETQMQSDNYFDVMFFFIEKYMQEKDFIHGLKSFEMTELVGGFVKNH